MNDDTKPLIDGIMSQALAEADAILAEARAKADAILVKAGEELKARTDEISAAAARRAEIEARRIATAAELEARRELLQAKVDLLDRAFDGALRRLLSLPEQQWRDLVRRLLLDSSVSGTEEIKVPAGERERFQALLPEVNAALKQSGRRGELRLAGEPAAIEGGFILTGPDYAVDCSFRTLLAERRPYIEPEAAAALFGA